MHISTFLTLASLLFILAGCNHSSPKSAKTESSHTTSPYFAQGQTALQLSQDKQARAGQILQEANQLRKSLLKVRSAIRSATDSEQKKALSIHASEQSKKLEQLQEEGLSLRKNTQIDLKRAQNLFEQAMIETWGPYIRTSQPMTKIDEETINFSHNTQYRSVHPSMLNRNAVQKKRERPEDAPPATLMPPSTNGQNPPESLDISSFQLSAKHQFFAHIEALADQQTDENTPINHRPNAIPLNSIHQWRLVISDIEGKPLQNATISVTGHMPGHVHGLPTAPRVTQELSAGVYLVEGLKFQMQGWWVMQFNIEEHDTIQDSITFNLVL